MKFIALLAISAVWLAEGSFAVPAAEPSGAQARAAVPLFGARATWRIDLRWPARSPESSCDSKISAPRIS